ncbi:conjugative transposon protein TraK [Arachidicoccus sp.]|uniref:conjugative transposon protein TraK n=1 Tax=Arachidicoccus sp. TaxID=1872624 RepID=UPI003D1B082C
MFQQMKNIDTAFRYIRLTTALVIIGCIGLCLFVLHKSYQLASLSQNRIYVLANGKAIEAFASTRDDNIAVEAKDHIKTFHRYFFTLSPDEAAIKSNISKALYLADGTANTMYKNLQEGNYYAGIISGNINQTIVVDSIQLDLNYYPYHFVCYATEKLTRPTSLTYRKLITEGYLRFVERSENNAHGFLIERWEIKENKDLQTLNR